MSNNINMVPPISTKKSERTNSNSISPRKLAKEPIIIGEDDSNVIRGDFIQDDVPFKLVTAKLTDNVVTCLVEWMVRKDGTKPADSFISNKVLREKCPHLLLDFYESRLRFPGQ